MKTCKVCKQEKPKTEFGSHKSTKDRLRPQCKECRRLESNAYNQIDPEYSSIRKKIYYIDNRERLSSLRKEYYKENKDDFSRRHKKCVELNPDGVKARSAKRRALKAMAQGSHTAKEVGRLFFLQRGLCASCQQKLFKSGNKKYHLDHIVPLARGGSNDKYNLQCLCPTCNLRKNAKDPISWANENGKLL